MSNEKIALTVEEREVVQLEQGARSVRQRLHGRDQSSYRRRPSDKPRDDSPPVDPMPKVIRTVRLVQVREPNALPAQQEVVGAHEAHDGREEDREGGHDGKERRCAIDELPRLDDPDGEEGDERAAPDVDIAREHP